MADEAIWERVSWLVPADEVTDWRLVVLYAAAAEAGLLSHLPADAEGLATELGLDPRAVRVVLEALAVWGVVDERDGEFAPGPAAPGPDAAAVLRHHARSLRMWSARLDDALRGIAPQQPSVAPRHHLESWLDALAVKARVSAPPAVDACLSRIPGARRVLDLGGGHGEYALEFARRGLEVTMQDREEVVDLPKVRRRLEEAGVALFGGDFFATLPDGQFDVVFCAGVVFTYPPARVGELFARVRGAVASGGALAVHTYLGGHDPLAAVFAVQMLAGGRGGDTHREDDYRRWLAEAGYGQVETVHLDQPPESLVFART